MLPGFRFLFATVVLSVSVLVFALGAAALLRAAHEDFASLPAAHAVREARVAQERDARQATLALLRVEMIADQDTNVEKMAAAAAERVSEPTEATTSSAPTPVASVPDVAAPVAVPSTEATAAPVAVTTTEPPAVDPLTVVAAVTDRPQPDAQAPVASAPAQEVVPQPDVKVAALADPAAAGAEVATAPPIATIASKSAVKTDVKAVSKAATPTAAKPAKAKRAAVARHNAASRSRARAAAQVMQQQMPPNDPFAGFGNQRTAAFPR